MKGIVLAGGAGSRLHPATLGISKQLLPVYDKPMIYYPLSTLMLAGIRRVLVITTPADMRAFKRMLGDGAHLGMELSYAAQPEPRGLADAFLIGRDFIADDDVALILGDNIFYGHGLAHLLQDEVARLDGCTLFGYAVADAGRYGVVELSADERLVCIVEKPREAPTNIAVTGLYLYDCAVIDIAASLKPSARGELEITDVNNRYIDAGRARLVRLGRGTAWLDTGTHDSLLEASHFIQVLQHRQNLRIACLEEIAYRMGFIDADGLARAAARLGPSSYGDYVSTLAATASV